MGESRNSVLDRPRQQVRQVAAASVGNAVEWYDWYIYTFLTPVFASQVFASGDQVSDVLSTFAVFAVGFFFRPIGGLLIGSLADRWGRKNTLTMTILLMGAGSLVIALTPTHDSAGIWAPVVLVAGRLLSGFSVGGEFAANTTFLIESAPPRRRGLYASFQYVTTTVGQLLASLTAFVLAFTLTDAQLEGWGWRAGFLIGALLSLVGLWIRKGAEETRELPVEAERPGILDALRLYPRATLQLCGVTIAGTIVYYTWTTYLPTYAEQNSGIELDTALLVSTISLIFFGLVQPLLGMLSDRVGRRPVLIAFATLFAAGIVPALALVRANDSFGGLLTLSLVGMLVLALFTSVSAAVNAELIPGHVRAAGIGFPYSLTVALFGGTAPYMGTLFSKIGHPGLFGGYVALLCLVSLAVYLRLPETAHRPLPERSSSSPRSLRIGHG